MRENLLSSNPLVKTKLFFQKVVGQSCCVRVDQLAKLAARVDGPLGLKLNDRVELQTLGGAI